MASRFRKIAITAVGVCAGTALTAWSLSKKVDSPYQVWVDESGASNDPNLIFRSVFQVQVAAAKPKRARRQLPPRHEQLARLQGNEEFDVLIIGGGATGAGCALDSTTRGLKTALVELDDFASGTSSRSTKLIHGGVRYLQKAILGVFTRC